MHTESISEWQHQHTFGQDAPRAGESRTLAVIALTATMMVLEVAVGVVSGSMALLADGLHMASHASALGITALAYSYTRRHASDPRFSFGSGKVNSLAGFTGALLLGAFALLMATESIDRLLNPTEISFGGAIVVAVLGLVVNGVCVLALDVHEHDGERHHHDHNLRSAYLHVLADALTSVLAIVALLSAKFFGLVWMDPLMGLVGALLVSRWSWGLLRESSAVLLDHQAPDSVHTAIRDALESEAGDRISDLHVWAIAPGRYAAIIGIVTHAPKSAETYRMLLPENLQLAHTSIEVHHCQAEAA